MLVNMIIYPLVRYVAHNKQYILSFQTKESCSDEVEAFILDTEFDYDNVTLTPKYSGEEMAIMMNASSLAK